MDEDDGLFLETLREYLLTLEEDAPYNWKIAGITSKKTKGNGRIGQLEFLNSRLNTVLGEGLPSKAADDLRHQVLRLLYPDFTSTKVFTVARAHALLEWLLGEGTEEGNREVCEGARADLTQLRRLVLLEMGQMEMFGREEESEEWEEIP